MTSPALYGGDSNAAIIASIMAIDPLQHGDDDAYVDSVACHAATYALAAAEANP